MAGVVSIPAEAPFATTLARGLLAEHGPRGLARLRVVLPSRRACLVVQEAFLDANGGAPLLPPRLIPVGDAAGELGLLDAAAEWGVPPALGDLRRRFLLFELVRRVQAELPDEQAFRLADALRALIDELDQEDVPLTALAGLEAGDAPEHWQRIARFLDVLAGTWGAVEREAGGIGRVARRGRLLTKVATRWRARDPGPVVVAGVTGSVPAVAGLMATVAALPGGRVVLPGLDPAPAPGLADALGPAHPQWGFARLLARLGLDPAAVPCWPDDLAGGEQRRRLLGAMTTPTALTPPAVELDRALDGVEMIEAPDVASEALAVALRLRELLETDARALVVAPDRQLARRIAAELQRFELTVEDSAGQPLDQTAPGTFALLVAHAALDPDPVVPCLALLKHPLARAGRDGAECRRLARALERRLREGVESPPGWKRLQAAARDAGAEVAEWFDGVAGATADLRAAREAEGVAFIDLLAAHRAALDALARDDAGDDRELWAGTTGHALAAFLDELAAAATTEVAAAAFAPMLASAMAASPVRRVETGHPQVEILGRFEARLGSADLVVLAGLNEGAWPPAPDPGPWLARRHRDALGLPPPEQHLGFAAHDFVQLAASAPRLLLTRSRRDAAGAPTVASRLLDQWRRVLARARPPREIAPSPALDWALAFDRPDGPLRPIARPEPAPPAAARPRRLSVSDVEKLIHNPYAVYAARVLRLEPLEPAHGGVDARERGLLVHQALERFVRAYPEVLPEAPEAALVAVGAEVFDRERLGDATVALWWPRFLRVAGWFVETESARRGEVERVVAEARAKLRVAVGDGEIELRGRIDRLDRRRDGSCAIVDYKTGTAPRKKEVTDGLRPQLPLLAALVEGGGLGVEGAAMVSRLAYLELKGGEPPGVEPLALDDPAEVVARTLDGVRRLLGAYAGGEVPYLPLPRPRASVHPDPVAPLARDQEWLDGEAGG
jgi:ATP-dependent helicase/nuclease subunit B